MSPLKLPTQNGSTEKIWAQSLTLKCPKLKIAYHWLFLCRRNNSPVDVIVFQLRKELESGKRRLEQEIVELRHQVEELTVQREDLTNQLRTREQELTVMSGKLDEEGAAKATLQRLVRDLEAKVAELQEDMEMEKEVKAKIERQKQDIAEVRLSAFLKTSKTFCRIGRLTFRSVQVSQKMRSRLFERHWYY